MKKLLALLALAAIASVAHAQTADYAVQFNRKATVGEQYRVVSTGTDDQAVNVLVNSQPMPPRSDTYSFEFVAACEVLAVTERGNESKTQLTIAKLVRTAGGKSIDVLPAGSVVLAERVGTKTTLTMAGTPLNPRVASLLEIAGVHMPGDREATDDDVFGPKGRKKIGETWAINAEAAADSFSKRGMQVNPANVSGSASIVEATEQDGIPAIRLAATVSMKNLTPPMLPNVTIDSSDVTATFGGLLPVDGTRRRLSETMSVAMNIAASGTNNGATMAMTMTKKTTRETRYVRD